MNKTIKKIAALSLVSMLGLTVVGCNTTNKDTDDNTGNENLTINYNFDESLEGFTGQFADLPTEEGTPTFYELDFKLGDIPIKGNEGKGIYMKGNNHSDDLFMSTIKKLDKSNGLEPNTKYKVELSFDIATNVSAGMVGIGGSPGSSVFVKAGVVNVEPRLEKDSLNHYRLNIDKGNQSTGGEDMTVLGNIEKDNGTEDNSFQYKSFTTTIDELTTNESGEAWLIIGVDSGFEGLTELYYDNINIEFSAITE